MKQYLKKALLSLSVIALIGCTNSSKTDWALYELNGKVKTYTENYYKAVEKFGEWQAGNPEDYRNYRVNFSADGMYKQMDFLDKENTLRQRMVPKHKDGKVTEELMYDEEGELQSKTVYNHISDTKFEFTSYDIHGKETAKGECFLKDDRVIRRDYKILDNGRVLQEIRIKFNFNAEGLPSSLEQTNPDGTVSKNAFKYIEFDDQNNWTKRLDYASEDSKTPDMIVIRTYEYY